METQKIREILGRLADGEGNLELRMRRGGGPLHTVAAGATRPLETAVAAEAAGRRAVLRFAAGLTIEIGRATLAIRWSAPESDEFAGGPGRASRRRGDRRCAADPGGLRHDRRRRRLLLRPARRSAGRRDRYGRDVRRPRDPDRAFRALTIPHSLENPMTTDTPLFPRAAAAIARIRARLGEIVAGFGHRRDAGRA